MQLSGKNTIYLKIKPYNLFNFQIHNMPYHSFYNVMQLNNCKSVWQLFCFKREDHKQIINLLQIVLRDIYA